MMDSIAAALRTKQFKNLQKRGLKLASTDRQLENGTIVLTGKFKVGRKVIEPTYAVTANGAVLSNKFVARRVDDYRAGLQAVTEILDKRVAA